MAMRCASHAGSWYSGEEVELRRQLTDWIERVRSTGSEVYDGQKRENLRALIAPHAGYDYSGPTAAYAYAAIDPTRYKRVFVLGPSHHHYMTNCALTRARELETPVGVLTVDEDMVRELHRSNMFQYASSSVDEAEHSIELHLPFVAHVFQEHLHRIKAIPIIVGSLEETSEAAYGQLFAKYLADPDNLFIISSDFCHWGLRFRYTYHDTSCGEIYESISVLDHKGMELIEKQDPQGFLAYRDEFKNTICGRHPIQILLFAIEDIDSAPSRRPSPKHGTKFVRYAQSSKCRKPRDSSVSYASAHIVSPP